MLTTVASRSTRWENTKSESSAPPIDTRAPTIGIPAAMKPPKTKNMTRKVRGSAMPSPRTRSRSTVLVMASMTLPGLPTVPCASIAAGTSSSAFSAAASASSCAAASRPGSKSTTVTKPPAAGVPPSRSGAAVGSVSPPGASSGERTAATPGTWATSCDAAVPSATTSGSVRSAPVTCMVSVSSAGWVCSMIWRAFVDSDSTVGAPEESRLKSDSPVTPPTATAKQLIVMRTQATTHRPGCRAMARPRRASRVGGASWCARLVRTGAAHRGGPVVGRIVGHVWGRGPGRGVLHVDSLPQ